MEKTNAYQVITDRIICLLKAGSVPWHKPWKGGGEAKNLVSMRGYRGINRFLLNAANYASPFWLTYIQAKNLGGHIGKGEKSTPVVFWKLLEKEDDQTGEIKEIPVLRYYRVFNLEQAEGIEAPEPEVAERQEFTPIERCEQLVAGMPNPPKIQYKSQAAWYRPKQDLVNMPKPESFDSPEEVYSCLYHELAHSSGHKSRLNRSTLTDMCPFGSTNYSKEELVAEMCAAFLCGVTGIENQTIDNSAAYINGWLKRLRNDDKLVVFAAAQAQKAADYIQGIKYQPASRDTSQPAKAAA
jgi:antirestriction protein ArdC